MLRLPRRWLRSALLAALVVGLLGIAPTGALGSESPVNRADAGDSNATTLVAGEALVAGSLRSTLSNGWYTLAVSSGSVDLSETIPVAGAHGPDWSTAFTWFREDPTGRFNKAHDRTQLRLRDNGDLALITSGGQQLWHSGTGGRGGVRLTLRRTGLLALTTASGRVVWSSRSGQTQMSGGMRLKPGQRLRNAWETAHPGGKPRTLTMQRDGNLVHRCGPHITWQTHTHVRKSTFEMSNDGALRVVTPRGRVVWRSHASRNHDHAHLNSTTMMVEADGIELIWYARLDERAC